jgi:hypothetical protein
MEKAMEENLKLPPKRRAYLKGGLVIFASLLVLGGVLVSWKGPNLVKTMAKTSLRRGLAPLGIEEIKIGTVRFGLGRIYLRDIASEKSPSHPSLYIQELDLALSIFFNVKAIDVVGAILELDHGDNISLSKAMLEDKAAQFGKMIVHLKNLKLPTIAMHDCLLVIPSSQGPLKLPIHAVTETTVTRNKVFTIDWGEAGTDKFSGQLVLDASRNGTTIDIHSTNIDFQSPTFQIKAPEISLWGTTGCKGNEGYKLDGFAKLDRLMLSQYGSLKMPLEVNLEGEGTEEEFELDELTIMSSGAGKNFLELEGSFKPTQSFAKIALTTQIAQLSNLWDFTPLLATHSHDKVSLGGKVNLSSEIVWEAGSLKTSVLALEIKGGNLTREGLSVEGVNTQFLFQKLQPLTTKGNQRLTAKTLSIAGLEAKNLDFQCLFDAEGLFQIKQISADVLGGNMLAHRFQRDARATEPSFQFETDFKGVELGELLKLTDLDNLKGQAKLAGNASMNYRVGTGLDVLQAELHSISDSGLIQYKPHEKNANAHSEHEHVNMAHQVLDNFNFSVFNVRLEHAADKPTEMQGIIKLLGSNPNFLNGYPFEFNIVTTGPLKDLAMSFLNLMKPPTLENTAQLVNNAANHKTKKEKIKKEKIKKVGASKGAKSKEHLIASAPRATEQAKKEVSPILSKAPIVHKPIKKVKKVSKAKRVKPIKAAKAQKDKKASENMINIKPIKTANPENRKMSDG